MHDEPPDLPDSANGSDDADPDEPTTSPRGDAERSDDAGDDADSPGRSLLDDDDVIVEPNEPA